MAKDEFAERITAMTDTLYRISYSLCRCRAEQEDAVSETILRAWEKLDTLRNERYFQTWVVRILLNQCYAAGRERLRLISLEELQQAEASLPPETAELREAVMALPEELRLPVILHYMEGYKLEEIADILDIPPGTVKSRLHRARSILKSSLYEEVQQL